MDLAEEILKELVRGRVVDSYPAKPIVEEALRERETISECGQILVLNRFCPWKEHLFMLEKEKGLEGVIKFVIFQDTSLEWRVQAINNKDSFSLRRGLKQEWRGIIGLKLAEISQMVDIVFCHNTGFIGGAKTKESTIRMAKLSLID